MQWPPGAGIERHPSRRMNSGAAAHAPPARPTARSNAMRALTFHGSHDVRIDRVAEPRLQEPD
ncbi:hypothetical protein NPS74_21210, partial [Cutibacterium acnes subsp. acnes]|nr:hypothetical protein [Cutibacterium acnes subsp. acnes]